MVDLLTTNETYFFREPKHFEFLRDEIISKRKNPSTFRVWSAASSSGEEIYTLAMVLADSLPNTPWEIVGSDISTQVLAKAATGHYSLARTEGIPAGLHAQILPEGRALPCRHLPDRAGTAQADELLPDQPDACRSMPTSATSKSSSCAT